MSAQPEALRLAEFYEALAEEPPKSPDNSNIRAAAAELRRLSAENERLKTVPMKYRRMEFNAQLQTENDRLRAQRDALLEACKTLVNLPGTEDWIATLRLAVEQARAAIKAVEE